MARLRLPVFLSVLLLAQRISFTTPAVELISVDVAGTGSGNADSGSNIPAQTPDGRYVFFISVADNLTGIDTNGLQDLFVRDTETGVTTLVSVNGTGTNGGNGESFSAAFTPDGRFVAFASDASDLVANDTNGAADVFVRDMATGTTTLASFNLAGTNGGNDFSQRPLLSDNGRYVAFTSAASNLVSNDFNGVDDLFIRDLQSATTTLVSINADGIESGDNGVFGPSALSADGRVVAFTSESTDLVGNDTNGPETDVFVRDLQTATTTLVSVGNASTADVRDLTPDGRYLLFRSSPSFFSTQLYVFDRQSGTTTLVSINAAGTGPGNGSVGTGGDGDITPDGRFVVFATDASNLVGTDTNGVTDVFVRDLQAGTTMLVSINAAGTGSGDNQSTLSIENTISSDGRYVLFTSAAMNLVSNDTNGAVRDVFVRDLQTGVTTLLTANSAGNGSGNAESFALGAEITPDGGFAVFSSRASDLVSNVTNPGFPNVFRATLIESSGSDEDDDGIEDTIDVGDGSFADGGVPPTTGSIVDAGGLAITVTDSTDPLEGVIVTTGAGSGVAVINACGFQLDVFAQSTTVITCGSIVVRVIDGGARVHFQQGTGVVELGAGSAVKVSEDGQASLVENIGGQPLTVIAGTTRTLFSGEELAFDTSYLHGAGGTSPPSVLFLDNAAPSGATLKYKDSPSVGFNGGNPWKTVGTWTTSNGVNATLDAVTDFRGWFGLKNSDDIGTRFDLRLEIRRNGSSLVGNQEMYCVEGITRNPNLAKEVQIPSVPITPVLLDGTLSMTVLTRIGTNGSEQFCGGHKSATGLRFYFDTVDRQTRFETVFRTP